MLQGCLFPESVYCNCYRGGQQGQQNTLMLSGKRETRSTRVSLTDVPIGLEARADSVCRGLAGGSQLFEATLSHDTTSHHIHEVPTLSRSRPRQSQLNSLRLRSCPSLFPSLPSRAPHELFVNTTDSLPRPCQRPLRAYPSTPARHPRRAQCLHFPSRPRTLPIVRLRVAGINRAGGAQLASLPSAQ